MDYAKIKQEAKDALKGKWGMAIAAYFILLVLLVPIQLIPIVGRVIPIFITGALTVGISRFALSIIRNQTAQIEDVFWGFKNYVRSLVAYLVMLFYVLVFLLLLIIPGIIRAFSYAMVSYILADDENISATDALAKSRKMMDGHKMNLFMLQLSFIGWAILCLFTFGIGFLWLGPWMVVSKANFYLTVKAGYEASQGDTTDTAATV